MPGKHYIEQAVGSIRQAAMAWQSDSHQIERQSQTDIGAQQRKIQDSSRRRHDALNQLSRPDNDQTRRYTLQKEVQQAERDIQDASNSIRQIQIDSGRRIGEARQAAAEADAIVGSISSMLGRSYVS